MVRLTIGLALALALAGCNTTSDTALDTLEPAAGSAPATADAAPADPAAAADVTTLPGDDAGAASAQVAESSPAQAAEFEPATPVDTSAVDQAGQAYLNCVVSNAARSAEGGVAHPDAVETGIDACRNQFREARWAYKDTGVTDDAADRYGANLLAFVRNEALTYLDAPPQ